MKKAISFHGQLVAFFKNLRQVIQQVITLKIIIACMNWVLSEEYHQISSLIFSVVALEKFLFLTECHLGSLYSRILFSIEYPAMGMLFRPAFLILAYFEFKVSVNSLAIVKFSDHS